MFNHEAAKDIINKQGLKRGFVADRAGVTHGTLSVYLGGRGKPSREFIERLAKALNVVPRTLWSKKAAH